MSTTKTPTIILNQGENLYTATHSHRHGQDTHIVRCNRYPTVDEVVELFDIDFEPNMGENIEVCIIDMDDIKNLK